jgi:HSP20 family protein
MSRRRFLRGDFLAMSMSFDPFSQLDRLAQSVFDTSRQPRLMPVDLFREGDRYVLNADLPGVDPGSVDVDVDGHLLTIRAERTEANRDNSRWLAQERPFGSYVRRFTIGDDVDAQSIHATYNNGVLSVMIPIAERAKPRKIQIESMASHDAKAVTA